MGQRWTDDDLLLLLLLHDEGQSFAEIAVQLGRSASAIESQFRNIATAERDA
ncbi:MAG: hypothetical protein AAF557_27730 [Pseudomonadota bacterium]